MSDRRITRLRDEEIPELIRVKAQVYGTEPTESPDHYRWKFFRNPHRRDAVPYWILWDRDRMLGGIGALPVRMMVFGTEVAGEFACEMFIDRSRQRSGLGTLLMDAYIKDSPLPLMMNTSHALLRFLLKRGFYDLSNQLHFWLRPLRPGAMLSARWGGVGGKVALLAGPVLTAAVEARATALRRPSDPQVSIEEVASFGPWADEAWSSSGPDYPVAVIRDLPYLRWKYDQHPTWKYRILRATRRGRVLGYLTFRLRSEPHGALMLVQEILAPRGDSGARMALLHHAIDEARRASATAVKALASDPAVLADLRGTGFFETRLSPGMLYPEQPGFDHPQLRDIASWYLTGGDSDLEYA